MAAKRGLGGKGLGALIPGAEEEASQAKIEGATLLPIDKIEPNPNQPRKNFDEDALNDLVESVKIHGIIEPLIVRKKDTYYEIVGGERRWRASRKAGIKELPVIIKDYTDRQVAEISLIDNIQREDLNPIEEAEAFKQLIDEFGLKHDEVAERVSKSRAAITNSMRLLKLDKKVQEMLIGGMISTGHARAILGIADGEDQVRFAERVFDEKMSVHETEREIRNIQKAGNKRGETQKTSPQLMAVYSEIEERLKTNLGVKVKISAKDDNKGSIELEYYSKEQLEEIIEKLEA